MNGIRTLGDLAGWTVVEHRPDGLVYGRIAYGEVHGMSLSFGWSEHDGGNRTTVFASRSWEAFVIAGVCFLRRKDDDEGDVDMPHSGADTYTLIPPGK